MKTKKSKILVLALTLISSTTFSDIGDIYDNANITYSYTAGAFFTIPVIESLAFQPEINYVRKGRSNETSELDTPFETDFMIQYIQVPVLLQYRNNEILSKSGSVFYINAGPYAGFALNPQTRESNNSEDLLTSDMIWVFLK